MKRLEAATLSLGGMLMSVALLFVDWRLGVFSFGALIVLSSIDLPRRRP